MNKRFQHVEQMVETARKADLAGIHVVFNIILGYPGETEEHRQQTFRFMSDIAKQYWNVSFSPNIFTPYPGIPIWPQLKEMGVREPRVAGGMGNAWRLASMSCPGCREKSCEGSNGVSNTSC